MNKFDFCLLPDGLGSAAREPPDLGCIRRGIVSFPVHGLAVRDRSRLQNRIDRPRPIILWQLAAQMVISSLHICVCRCVAETRKHSAVRGKLDNLYIGIANYTYYYNPRRYP